MHIKQLICKNLRRCLLKKRFCDFQIKKPSSYFGDGFYNPGIFLSSSAENAQQEKEQVNKVEIKR